MGWVSWRLEMMSRPRGGRALSRKRATSQNSAARTCRRTDVEGDDASSPVTNTAIDYYDQQKVAAGPVCPLAMERLGNYAGPGLAGGGGGVQAGASGGGGSSSGR